MSAWQMRMGWNDVCFLHWRVSADVLRPTLPPGVELDLHHGTAWISIVPFRMTNIRGRGFPPLPGFGHVPEINVRTYVLADGHPAVWFYSLDAAGPLVVESARFVMALPYFNATIVTTMRDGAYAYHSERHDRRGPRGRFDATWRIVGDPAGAQPGSIQAFLHERYRFVVTRRRRPFSAGVTHEPWLLHPIEVTIADNTLVWIPGLELARAPDQAFFAHSAAVRTTALQPVFGMESA
jgi:uncharacterized protein YqjF (DUF2071 family)